jgi:hypothetical protein
MGKVSALVMAFRFHGRPFTGIFYGPRVFSSPHCKRNPQSSGAS